MDAATLEKITREYGLAVSPATLEAALHDVAFRTWAEMHLTSENLLTTDELAAYSSLQHSGTLDRLAATEDLFSPGLALFTESEVSHAIHALSKSTAQISKHTDLLRAHAATLAKLADAPTTTTTTTTTTTAAPDPRRARDIAAAKDRAAHSLAAVHHRLDGLRAWDDRVARQMAAVVTAVGDEDNAVLRALDDMARDMTGPETGREAKMERLSEASTRLINTTVQLLRTRLDRIYLEGLNAPLASSGFGTDDLESTEALQVEVESLYSEISPVAQMAVEAVFLDPATRDVQEHNGAGLRATAAGLRYSNDCLDYLLARILALSDRFAALHRHRATAGLIADAASALTLSDAADKPRRRPTISEPMTPVAPRRARRSDEPETPLDKALRAANLPAAADPAQALLAVRQAAAARSEAALQVKRNAQASFESSTAHALADSKRDVALLLGNLTAEYPFGRVGLDDPSTAESLAWMAREVQSVEEELAEVGSRERGEGREKRDEFVRTWA